jgi:plasmid stabilization system protein ParE
VTVRFLGPARAELREGVRYYEGQRPNLGAEFRDAVRAGVERILQNPLAWHPHSQSTRRYLLHRFPYGIIYQVRQEEILIIAVAHLHREPQYWHGRVDAE